MTLTNRDLKEMLGLIKPKEPRTKNAIDVNAENTVFASFVSIETGAVCNRRCSFCPVSHAPREEDEYMSDEMFDHIIDQLVAMDFRQRIALYSYNEPMRDPRLLDLIKKVRTRLPRTCIMINSNGDYFKTADDIAALFHAGLNQMQINIYSSADGSGNQEKIASGIKNAEKRYAKMKELVDSLPWLDQEASLYQHIGASKTACQVVPKWDFQPTDGHDNTMPTQKHGLSVRHHIANRAGNIPNFMPALTEPLQKMCIRPFRAMTINWRGDIILCCNDYHASASTGNVMERSLLELWNDPRYHAYRIKLQAKDRNIHLCDTCDYNGGFYQHNVPHVTLGQERDMAIVAADMRSKESAGFGQLVQLGKK